ncbi:MAG: S46 family peptidase [Armatimonadota bacterium]|nr:S46 family peptidase [Armatimonadota bacterium]MDW8155791.1 S46 family peptidase [Armatimonadota bacterium]
MLAAVLVCAVLVPPVRADEGFWPLHRPPVQTLWDRYQAGLDAAWLQRLQGASVRLVDRDGFGSGAFVGERGLVVTNHHVLLPSLMILARQGKLDLWQGFYAATREQELRIPGLTAHVLVSVEDVTEQVRVAEKPGGGGERLLRAREARLRQIERESERTTGLASEVVRLYGGQQYWLHRYRRYTDVRLVFLPELQAAYFGGFQSVQPAFLDVAFVRVYDGGQPVRPVAHLVWDPRGPARGELVFVSGHPGETFRFEPSPLLRYRRAQFCGPELSYFGARVRVLRRYLRHKPTSRARIFPDLFLWENFLKGFQESCRALWQKRVVEVRRREEAKLRAKVHGDPWAQMDALVRKALKDRVFERYIFRSVRGAELAEFAVDLVREARTGSLSAETLSLLREPQSVELGLEEAMLAELLAVSLRELGPNDAFVRSALEGRTPAEVARRLVRGTRLGDQQFREALARGGARAVLTSDDPLLRFAARIDPLQQQARRAFERFWGQTRLAEERIARAKRRLGVEPSYPDATGTLRLSFGVVRGYETSEGTQIPAFTTLYDVFGQATSFQNQGHFELPRRFWERRSQLVLSTRVNFYCSCDVSYGNSGSPVVSREGKVVGVVWGFNAWGGGWSLAVYDSRRGRAGALHAGYVVELLDKVYEARELLTELLGSRAR